MGKCQCVHLVENTQSNNSWIEQKGSNDKTHFVSEVCDVLPESHLHTEKI